MLGIESVPDGLATGLLAGVNPLAGVYGYMVGTAAGALATSSTFMAVQGTGAMAILVADVSAVHDAANPARALFTLAMLTGVVMAAAGLLRLGTVLRFVSNAVMVGFINAVGVNILLGQLANLTGYSSPHGSRLTRALDTVLHPGRLHGQSVAIGLATIVLIVVLERTPLGPLGLVVAVVVTSAAAKGLGWDIATVHDLGATLGALPRPQLPDLSHWCHPSSYRHCPWRWWAWCREPASRPTSPTRTAVTQTRRGTSLDRAWPTWRPGSFKGCPSAGRCPRHRSTRPPGPAAGPRW